MSPRLLFDDLQRRGEFEGGDVHSTFQPHVELQSVFWSFRFFLRCGAPPFLVDHIDPPVTRDGWLFSIERLEGAFAFVDVQRRGAKVAESDSTCEAGLEARGVALECKVFVLIDEVSGDTRGVFGDVHKAGRPCSGVPDSRARNVVPAEGVGFWRKGEQERCGNCGETVKCFHVRG